MSGTKSSQGGLTRRSFLKTTATAGALGLAGAVGMTTAGSWLSPATAIAEPAERTSVLCHQFHCLSSCGLQCTVRDGRLVKVEPRPNEDGTPGHICLRGISEVQHVYSADRIQTPLKRVGERGAGEFVPITWDEAVKTIADAIKDAKEKYGEGSFFYRKCDEPSASHNYEFLSSLLHADTGGRWGLDRGQANGSDWSGITSAGLAQSSIRDWVNAKTIIHLGSNLVESAITWSKYLFDAKDAGAKMIAIDVRYSPTAQKADQFIAVKPATDAALMLGVVNQVLENNWYDESFMVANTSMPFLVSRATGEIMGAMVEVIDEATGEVSQVKRPYVWDSASGEARVYDEVDVTPSLMGEFVVDGEKAVTEFTLLSECMASYTPAWASGVCGVAEDVIVELADQYANGGPAIISFGFGGPDKYANADILGHTSAVLTAITGNVGKPGTGLGFYGVGGATPGAEGITRWSLPAEFSPVASPVAFYDMPFRENNIHCALTFGDVFSMEAANANATLEWVKTLDFYAISDIYYSTACLWADIVLPACSKFESAEEVSDIRTGFITPHVYLNQKCIDPLFEAKHDIEIERLIAAEFGLDKYLPSSMEELAKFMLAEPAGNMEGMSYEALREKGAMRLAVSDEPILAFTDQVYPTETGRIELYYEALLFCGQQFPAYEDANEAYESNPDRATYPLVFVQGKTRFRIHSYYSGSAWFEEYYGPLVNVSPIDAEARGITTGDDVVVFNDRGSFKAKAAVNNAVQPSTVFMAEMTYQQHFDEGYQQNVTNSFKQERCYPMKFGPQIPYNDSIVEMKKA